jgi:endonuclease/exonuclease/phosphatase family metal-dependent hydrolase
MGRLLRELTFFSFLIFGAWSCRPPSSFELRGADGGAAGGADDLATPVDGACGRRLAQPGVLRAATFNTHLFFDTTCDSGQCAAGDFEQAPTSLVFSQRADALAGAVRCLGADVVALQEIETQTCLDALTSRLRDLYPTAVLGETGAAGSIDVAVLGAGRLLEVRRHRGMTLTRPDGSRTYFSREFLEVHMEQAGRRVVLFAAHFRSKVSDDPGRRLAEAQAARDIITATAKELPDAVVLFGGDLNDTPGSPPLLALESDPALLRVAKDRPASAVATYSWNGAAQAIDHLFLVQRPAAQYVAGSASAVRDGAQDKGLAGSDHAALRADFTMP